VPAQDTLREWSKASEIVAKVTLPYYLDVVKKKVTKLLQARIIYPILNSQ